MNRWARLEVLYLAVHRGDVRSVQA